jgi:hypothetical protein
MRRRFKPDPKWITVRYVARCAEPNCQRTGPCRWGSRTLVRYDQRCGAPLVGATRSASVSARW